MCPLSTPNQSIFLLEPNQSVLISGHTQILFVEGFFDLFRTVPVDKKVCAHACVSIRKPSDRLTILCLFIDA